MSEPASPPVSPQDLIATIFHVLKIPQKIQFEDQFGRLVYMIEDGKPSRESI